MKFFEKMQRTIILSHRKPELRTPFTNYIFRKNTDRGVGSNGPFLWLKKLAESRSVAVFVKFKTYICNNDTFDASRK